MSDTPTEPAPDDDGALAGMNALIAAMKDRRPNPRAADIGIDTTLPAGAEVEDSDDLLAAAPWGAVELGADPRAGALPQGATVGRLVILQELGAGGMGVVYAAYDPELDRKVALKLVRPGSGGRSSRTRLLREAQALAKLSHPNVVSIHDVGTVGAQVWIAMEFVRGRTLKQWLEAPQRWQDVLEIMRSAGAGLAAAHAAHLLHRDFKPDNVMVGDDGRVRVMDFGLARVHLDGTLEREDPDQDPPSEPPSVLAEMPLHMQLTHAGTVLGTPGYMAPEQLGGMELTAAADQFAFCITLWEALFGERPFAGDTRFALAAQVLSGRLRPPPKGVAVPGWLRRACERGLSVDPERRWTSMNALLEALAKGRMRARVRVGLVAVAGLATLGAAAEGQKQWEVARRVAACEAAGHEIDDDWNDEQRQVLREALLSTNMSYAATTADKVAPVLDQWAGAWRDASTEACLDAEVRGRWDAETLERSRWCLDQRRTMLKDLVGELASADATILQKAVPAAVALPTVTACRDVQTLERLVLPPLAARDRVRSVRDGVAQASTLARAGRYAKGLELARASMTDAKALEWPPLRADAHYELGIMLAATGDHAAAESELDDAYFDGLEGDAPQTAFLAATELVELVGYRAARHDEGRRWGRHAEALLSKVPSDDLGRARLLLHLAYIDEATGEYDHAEALYERSLAVFERTVGPHHPDVASVHTALVSLYRVTSRYERARIAAARALAIDREALGPDHPNVAGALTNLGTALSDLGEHEGAKAAFEQALAIYEHAVAPDHLNVGITLHGLAGVLYLTGDYQGAVAVQERVVTILTKAFGPEHPNVAASINNLGAYASATGDHARARTLFEQGLTIREKVLGPEHPDVAKSLTNLAHLHQIAGEHHQATALLVRSLAIREQALGLDHAELAESLEGLGAAALATGDREGAREHYERARAILEAAMGPEQVDVARSLVGLAKVALADDRSGDALPLATRALELRERASVAGDDVAVARFVLARALWEAPEGAGRDRARARALAEQARSGLRAAGTLGATVLSEVDAWLGQHGDAPP